ncbi:MAG: lytic transglycosylase domain-containing protein [Holosporales bacterium]|jgi:soluble lytic murein transglycosylase-like protein|nr:lytic transglycosylase domain-containing protein [Holosporales bacterium]
MATLVTGCATIHPAKESPAVGLQAVDGSGHGIRGVIAQEESKHGIPAGLLDAIAAVESEYAPHLVNTRTKDHRFKTKQKAAQFAQKAIAAGNRNMSVGCMQIHYKSHSQHFGSVDEMLDPNKNIAYGAQLLRQLYNKYKSWEKAVKLYHASKPKYNVVYFRKVMKKYAKKL